MERLYIDKHYISSGEFAKLCDTSKETLRHYKDIGLLIPKYEKDNGYQYYDAEQFYDYYAIAIFKKTGTPLAKIKECIDYQNIPSILKVLADQQESLAKEQRKLEQMQFVIKNSISNMSMGLSHDSLDLEPKIGFFNKEHLLAVPHNEFSISKEDQDDDKRILISVLRKYKEICDQYNVHTDYQLGAMIQVDNKNTTHLYTRVNKAYKNPYYKQKPAGNYLYIIQKCCWDLSIAYKKFLDYIQENNIDTIGDIYAYDLAGFMLNGTEENSMTLISIQVVDIIPKSL